MAQLLQDDDTDTDSSLYDEIDPSALAQLAAGTAELVSSRCSSPAAQLAPLPPLIPPPLLLEASDLLELPTLEVVEARPTVVMCMMPVAMHHQNEWGMLWNWLGCPRRIHTRASGSKTPRSA